MKFFDLKNKKFSQDCEFLPSALEVQETPPSPLRLQLLYTICGLVVLTFIWSMVGKIDVIATAGGKVQPQGYVKVVESMVNGKVEQILVQNGDRVQAGQKLVLLEANDVQAQHSDISSQLVSWEAEIIRRKAEDSRASTLVLSNGQLATTTPLDWPDGSAIPDDIRSREDAVLRSELAKLNSDLEDIQAKLIQNQVQESSTRMAINSQESLIETLNQRVHLRKDLVEKQVVSRDDWLQVIANVKEAQNNLANSRAQLSNIIANKAILSGSFQQTRDNYVATNLQKLVEAERQAASLREKFTESQVQLNHMTLVSPTAGIIAASSLTTPGQVINRGDELMRVVPEEGGMEVIAYVPNQEIGFIREGQHVDVKINAFPFTRYGTVNGTVKKISKDAIPDADAQQSQRDPTHSSNNMPGNSGGGQATSTLVFPLTVSLSQNYIAAEGNKINLVPGMGVVAEIKTDRRRIIDYLISPVYDLTTSSLHER